MLSDPEWLVFSMAPGSSELRTDSMDQWGAGCLVLPPQLFRPTSSSRIKWLILEFCHQPPGQTSPPSLLPPMTVDPHTAMYQYHKSLHSVPYPLRAFRPWESAEPVCQLFLLATQMYFFYLVVNRVDVCTSNSSKTYKLHPGHWCSFLRGDIALAGQSQRPQWAGEPQSTQLPLPGKLEVEMGRRRRR